MRYSSGPLPPGKSEGETDWSRVAYGVVLGVLAAYQQFKLPPALPLLFDLYGYDRVLAGGFMSVYALAGLLFSVAIGRSLTRGGFQTLLVWAFVLLIAGNLTALAMPWSGPAVLASRLLEGTGFAVLALVGSVVAANSASERHRPIAIALWATWIPLGQVSSSLMAIPLIGFGLWRPLWWAGIVATVGVVWWGRLLGIGGNGVAGPVVGGPRGTGESKEGAVRSAQSGLLFLSASLFCLWTMQYISFMSWLPQYLVEARGLNPGAAALMYLLPPALVAVFNLVGGGLLRAGVRLVVLLPVSIAVQAVVWLLIPGTRGGVFGVLSLLVYGVSAGITPTCLFALPNAIMGNGASSSHGFAAIMTGRNLGALIGPVLLAQAVTAAGDWDVVAPLFGGVCIAAVGIGGLLGRRLTRVG